MMGLSSGGPLVRPECDAWARSLPKPQRLLPVHQLGHRSSGDQVCFSGQVFSSPWSVKQELFNAIHREDAVAIEQAIHRAQQKQIPLDSMQQGRSIPSHALMKNKALTPRLMQQLFDAGIDPRHRDPDGNSLLHHLMQNPVVNVELTECLLQKAPAVNPGNFLVETPLTHLLRNPAVTPEVVDLLLQKQARLSVPKRSKPMSHGLAANEGIKPEVLRLFLKALQQRKDAAKQLNCDTDQGAALHYLLRNSAATPEMVEILIEAGADVNLRSRHYFKAGTPLSNWAQGQYTQPVQAELLQVLLKHGATWGTDYWQAQRLMTRVLSMPNPDPHLVLQLMRAGRLMASDDLALPIPARVLDNPQVYCFFLGQLGKETNHFIKSMLKAEVKPQLEQLLASVNAMEQHEARLALSNGLEPVPYRKFSPEKASQQLAQDAFAIFKPGKHPQERITRDSWAKRQPPKSSSSDGLNYFRDCNPWFHSPSPG